MASGMPCHFQSCAEGSQRRQQHVLVLSGENSTMGDKDSKSVSTDYCILPARKLGIAWIDNENYWTWVTKKASWFKDVAYLHQVCWLDISGTIKDLNLWPGVYSLAFRVQMDKDAFGWQNLPINLTLKTSRGFSMQGSKKLNEEMPVSLWPGENSASIASQAWGECEVGLFRVDAGNAGLDIEFKMFDHESGRWKGGLFLDAAIIRPVEI